MKSKLRADSFFDKATYYREEIKALRNIILPMGLTETVKWGAPVYSFNGKNVVGIGSFRNYFGLWFFQGTMLSDPYELLTNAQEGKTMSMRQLRFVSKEEINESIIKAYITEAVENLKKGKMNKVSKSKPLIIPSLLLEALAGDDDLDKAFNTLGLTQKREFAEYIETAKKDITKNNRLKKIIPLIKQGIGLNDKYRK